MPTSRFCPIGQHGGRITEDFEHARLHAGLIFRMNEYYLLGAGSAVSIMLTTGAGETSLTAAVNSDSPGTGGLYESTVATGGSAITSLNGNRDNTDSSGVSLVKNPTISTVGTFLRPIIIGSTGFKSVSGGIYKQQCGY